MRYRDKTIMEGLILLLAAVYIYFLVQSGLNENTRIESTSFKGLMKLETLLILIPLLISIVVSFSFWGSLNGAHSGALILVFVITPSALLVVLAEIIIFGIARNFTTGIKALFLALVVFLYLWFTTEYGR